MSTRNTKPIGTKPFNQFQSPSESNIIHTKKSEFRQLPLNIETDYSALKNMKASFPNPVITYKTDYYQPIPQKPKMFGKSTNSLSYAIPDFETDRKHKRKDSPPNEEVYQTLNGQKVQKHGKAVYEFIKGQPTVAHYVTFQVAKDYPFSSSEKLKKNLISPRLPAIEDQKVFPSSAKKKRNDSGEISVEGLLIKDNIDGSESYRFDKNPSAVSIKQSPFYAYIRCKSPRALINKRVKLVKNTTECNFQNRYSTPFVEAYNEIATKMFAVGPKKVVEPSPPKENEANAEVTHLSPEKKVSEATSPRITYKLVSPRRMQESARSPYIMPDLLKVSGTKTILNATPNNKSLRENSLANRELHRAGLTEAFNTELNLTDGDDTKDNSGIKFHFTAGEDEIEKIDKEELTEAAAVQEKEAIKEKEAEGEREETSQDPQSSQKEAVATGSEHVKSTGKFKKVESITKLESQAKAVNSLSSSQSPTKLPIKKQKTLTTPAKEANEKEVSYMKKLEVYREFIVKMNFSFNMQIKAPTTKAGANYKFYIGKGNNHILIRALMKSRWWWTQTESKDPKEINFQWTQWRNKKFIESLAPIEGNHYEYIEENDKGESEVDESLKGVVTEPMKRLFDSREKEMIEKRPECFKNGNFSKDFDELTKQKSGGKCKEILEPINQRVCNHIEDNFHLANKKALLVNMRAYYTSIGEDYSKYLPLTFHIKNGVEDEEFKRFVECYQQREKEIQGQQEADEKDKSMKKLRNIWIAKPGEDTNKGKGICLVNSIDEVKEIIGNGRGGKSEKTLLVQSYLDKPLLYQKRKFDLRCYMLVSCINGVYKGYWYQEGYVRTTSKEFTLKNLTNKQIHLTNDAIQCKYDDYGKYEAGNKVSYSEFDRYIESTYGGSVSFYKDMYPQMKKLATDTIKAVYGTMDPYKRENTFEVFGLDFMIDSSYKVWLIEVNTNPDITIPSPKLAVLIPNMVENALRLTIDPLFPPPTEQPKKGQNLHVENALEANRFELVFDESRDAQALKKTLKVRQEALKCLSAEDKEIEEEGNEDE